MEALPVMAIGDVDPLVAGDGMRIDGLGGVDAVFPSFLHFGVHDQEGVVGEVDRDLALGVTAACCGGGFFLVLFVVVGGRVFVFFIGGGGGGVCGGEDFADAEFAGDA